VETKRYTKDWFDRCIPVWTEYLADFKDKPNLKFLEIGSYEGRSTCWLLDNILTHSSSTITCIDLFEGCLHQGPWSKELYETVDISIAHGNFLHNTEKYGDKVQLIVGCSQDILRRYSPVPFYNFVYIDGSHIASDVLEDGVLAFPLLQPNGIFIFDDYPWKYFDEELRHPKIAIDAFLRVYANQIKVLKIGRQVILRKLEQKEGYGEA
jgi:predicted O-methyltransferase YrrM